MRSQKLSSIKIPAFDKEHYARWKKKKLLFIKAVDPFYMKILRNGSYVPQTKADESDVGITIILAHFVAKEQSSRCESDKQKVALDGCLQLIIMESMDLSLPTNMATFESAKRM